MTISEERLAELRNMPDEDIDYSDIPETDEAFWADAILRLPDGTRKAILHVDMDIALWFKTHAQDSQALMNIVLRKYVEAHRAG